MLQYCHKVHNEPKQQLINNAYLYHLDRGLPATDLRAVTDIVPVNNMEVHWGPCCNLSHRVSAISPFFHYHHYDEKKVSDRINSVHANLAWISMKCTVVHPRSNFSVLSVYSLLLVLFFKLYWAENNHTLEQSKGLWRPPTTLNHYFNITSANTGSSVRKKKVI